MGQRVARGHMLLMRAPVATRPVPRVPEEPRAGRAVPDTAAALLTLLAAAAAPAMTLVGAVPALAIVPLVPAGETGVLEVTRNVLRGATSRW